MRQRSSCEELVYIPCGKVKSLMDGKPFLSMQDGSRLMVTQGPGSVHNTYGRRLRVTGEAPGVSSLLHSLMLRLSPAGSDTGLHDLKIGAWCYNDSQGVKHPTAADSNRAYPASRIFTYAKTSAQALEGPWPDSFLIQHQPSSTWLPLWLFRTHFDRIKQGAEPPPVWPVAAKAAKDGEPTVGSQLSSAAAPQPGDIMEDMDWEVEHSFVDESYLQELDSAVDMDVDLPARMGFPMLPRVPIRRLADDVQQQDGRSIVNLSAASQQRLPRLVLVVDTNVLICSVARRVVATIGKLLRPVSKQASASGGRCEETNEQAGCDDSQDMDMEADWLEVASAQCVNFDVIACVPLVVLKELDHIKGRTHQDGGHTGAECKRAQGARAAISLLLDDFKDPFFHVQEFMDKRAADRVDIGLEGGREPSADDRILQCCMHYQMIIEQAPAGDSDPVNQTRVVLLSQDKALCVRALAAHVPTFRPEDLLSCPAAPGVALTDEEVEQRLLNLLLTGALDRSRVSMDAGSRPLQEPTVQPSSSSSQKVSHDGSDEMAVDVLPSLSDAMQQMQLQQVQQLQLQLNGAPQPATLRSPSPTKKVTQKKGSAKAAAAAAASGDTDASTSSPASSSSPQPGEGEGTVAKAPGKTGKTPPPVSAKKAAAAAAAAVAAATAANAQPAANAAASRPLSATPLSFQPSAFVPRANVNNGGPPPAPPSGMYEEMQFELNLITQALGPLVESAFEAEHQAMWPNIVCRPPPWRSFDILTIVVKHCQTICKPMSHMPKGHHQVVRDLAMRMEQAAKKAESSKSRPTRGNAHEGPMSDFRAQSERLLSFLGIKPNPNATPAPEQQQQLQQASSSDPPSGPGSEYTHQAQPVSHNRGPSAGSGRSSGGALSPPPSTHGQGSGQGPSSGHLSGLHSLASHAGQGQQQQRPMGSMGAQMANLQQQQQRFAPPRSQPPNQKPGGVGPQSAGPLRGQELSGSDGGARAAGMFNAFELGGGGGSRDFYDGMRGQQQEPGMMPGGGSNGGGSLQAQNLQMQQQQRLRQQQQMMYQQQLAQHQQQQHPGLSQQLSQQQQFSLQQLRQIGAGSHGGASPAAAGGPPSPAIPGLMPPFTSVQAASSAAAMRASSGVPQTTAGSLAQQNQHRLALQQLHQQQLLMRNQHQHQLDSGQQAQQQHLMQMLSSGITPQHQLQQQSYLQQQQQQHMQQHGVGSMAGSAGGTGPFSVFGGAGSGQGSGGGSGSGPSQGGMGGGVESWHRQASAGGGGEASGALPHHLSAALAQQQQAQQHFRQLQLQQAQLQQQAAAAGGRAPGGGGTMDGWPLPHLGLMQQQPGPQHAAALQQQQQSSEQQQQQPGGGSGREEQPSIQHLFRQHQAMQQSQQHAQLLHMQQQHAHQQQQQQQAELWRQQHPPSGPQALANPPPLGLAAGVQHPGGGSPPPSAQQQQQQGQQAQDPSALLQQLLRGTDMDTLAALLQPLMQQQQQQAQQQQQHAQQQQQQQQAQQQHMQHQIQQQQMQAQQQQQQLLLQQQQQQQQQQQDRSTPDLPTVTSLGSAFSPDLEQ